MACRALSRFGKTGRHKSPRCGVIREDSRSARSTNDIANSIAVDAIAMNFRDGHRPSVIS